MVKDEGLWDLRGEVQLQRSEGLNALISTGKLLNKVNSHIVRVSRRRRLLRF